MPYNNKTDLAVVIGVLGLLVLAGWPLFLQFVKP
jgi:hypothetical protein